MFSTSRLHIIFSFLFFSFYHSLTNAAEITRGPYLQLANDKAITIRWRTNTSTDSVVRYGNNPANLNLSKTVSGRRTEHEVRITNLSPLTKYYYSVGSTTETIAGGNTSYRFTTSPIPGNATSTRIWLIGDSGTANRNSAAVYNAYLNYRGSSDTDLWVMLGDNAYNDGTDREYQAAVFDSYPELLRRTPVWPTLGNHDGRSADSSSESGVYYNIFTLPRNGEAGGLASGTEAYYSFDYGDIHFICLDSYETDRSRNGAMMTWLKNDLAANNQKWTIAFWHHPPYTKGSHNSDTERALIEMRQNALPIIESYGVDLVFSGHSHSYERSYLIDGHYGSSSSFDRSSHLIDGGNGRENGDGAYQKQGQAAHAGAIYTVAGASGKTSGGRLNHPAMYASLNELGSVVLDVSNNRLDAVHLRADGAITDSYTLLKGPDDTPPTITEATASKQNQVAINFSEKIDSTSAGKASNYSIDNGVNIFSAQASGSTATLNTSRLEQNINYTLTVNNVEDQNGNKIASNSRIDFDYQNIQTLRFQNNVAPTSSYNGTIDTYIASGAANRNFGNALEILADGNDGSNGELATLLQWDISSIPSGATITKAQVILDIFNPSSGSYNIYDNAIDWSESSATWSKLDPRRNRQALVASFSPVSARPHTIDLNSAGVAMVQDWVDNKNNGIIIMSSGTGDGIDIRSSEYRNSNLRPELLVTYRAGNSSGNIPPKADFTFTKSGRNVSFSDVSSDSDGSISAWSWDFGNGVVSSLQSPQYNYSSDGNYTVTLTVTDSAGATASTSKSISVSSDTPRTTLRLQQGLNGYRGSEDSYVASGRGNDNYGGNAAILADGSDGSRGELVSLLKWDLSSIPKDAKVVSASITLRVFDRSSSFYNLWEMTRAWSESSVNWNNSAPNSNRGDNIASFTPSATGTYTIDLNSSGLALVQGWINRSANNGFMIRSGGTSNGIDIRAKEYATQNYRPMLTIVYQ